MVHTITFNLAYSDACRLTMDWRYRWTEN